MYRSSRANARACEKCTLYSRKIRKTTCFCKTQSQNVLICFIDYLDSLNPNKQRICSEMLAAVSISLKIQYLCSPLRPDLPDYEFRIHGGCYLTEILANRCDPCSQSPGNFSLATMPVSQPPPKFVGGLHIPKHNVTFLYNICLDII